MTIIQKHDEIRQEMEKCFQLHYFDGTRFDKLCERMAKLKVKARKKLSYQKFRELFLHW